MTFLPVVARELAGAARKPSTYWLRTLAVGSALAIFVMVLGRSTASQIFNALGIITLGLCLLAGVVLT